MANLSTINGTRSFGGSVFSTGMRLEVSQIVEAHRRVDGGHKVGSLVLTFDPDD